MEAKGLEEDAAKGALTPKGPGPSDSDADKKKLWMGEVLKCLSDVIQLFGSSYKDSEWEISHESLTSLAFIGAGAQGMVFSGRLRGEIVAVKRLKDKTETDFKHLRKLNHENIVRFRGVCSSPPYCVIMEYCQYGPLFDFLHTGAIFTPSQVVQWAKEIACGMHYLHQNKIIHRDLKSPNILITDHLITKVSDFGTARVWDTDMSNTMTFAGTVAWMAPEVIRHEHCCERIDIWSYGVVLWELLTQDIPYRQMDVHAIMWGVGNASISLPIPKTVPDSLQQLMQNCWNQVPRNRPPFKIIIANLNVAGLDLIAFKANTFGVTQATWRREVQAGMNRQFLKTNIKPITKEVDRREEWRQARDARAVYEKQIRRAHELYMQVCTVKLQLEQREHALKKREMALRNCACAIHKPLKIKREPSSSSESPKPGVVVPDDAITTQPTSSRNKFGPTQISLKDPARKRKWVTTCGRDERWTPTKHSRICSAHFRKKDLTEAGIKRLHKNAVPTEDYE